MANQKVINKENDIFIMNRITGKEFRNFWMGISIIAVTLFHFCFFTERYQLANINVFKLFQFGYLGVDMFLFLSAYGLCYSKKKNTIASFYKSRFKRIYPLYIVFLILLAAFNTDEYLKIFILQPTGLSMFVKYGVEWYIPALTCMYISFPLIFRFVDSLSKKPILLYISMIFFVLTFPLITKVVYSLFVYRIILICTAVLMYQCEQNRSTLFFRVIVFTACLSFFFLKESVYSHSLLMPLILWSLSKVNIRNIKFVSFLGKHSLELYLAGVIANKEFMRVSTFEYIPTLFITLAIIVLLATLFHFIQKDFYLIFDKNGK